MIIVNSLSLTKLNGRLHAYTLQTRLLTIGRRHMTLKSI